LFIKDEVASCAPRKGQRLKAEQARRKRKGPESGPESGLGPAKRQRQALGTRLRGSRRSIENNDDDEDDDNNNNDKPTSDLLLIYNSVRGYCSAINEL
jgi:hypothetical protein